MTAGLGRVGRLVFLASCWAFSASAAASSRAAGSTSRRVVHVGVVELPEQEARSSKHLERFLGAMVRLQQLVKEVASLRVVLPYVHAHTSTYAALPIFELAASEVSPFEDCFDVRALESGPGGCGDGLRFLGGGFAALLRERMDKRTRKHPVKRADVTIAGFLEARGNCSARGLRAAGARVVGGAALVGGRDLFEAGHPVYQACEDQLKAKRWEGVRATVRALADVERGGSAAGLAGFALFLDGTKSGLADYVTRVARHGDARRRRLCRATVPRLRASFF